METKQPSALVSRMKAPLAALAGMGAAIFGIASAFATNGVTLDSSVITGAKAGLTDTWDTVNTSVNNQYLFELAVMFIGVAVIVGVVMYVLKGHRRI